MNEPYLRLYKDIVKNDEKLTIKSQFEKEKKALDSLKDEEEFLTEEEVNKEIENMATMYKLEADKLKEIMGDAEKEQMKKDSGIVLPL